MLRIGIKNAHENIPEPIGPGLYQTGFKDLDLVAWKRLGLGGVGVNPETPGLRAKIPGKENKSVRIDSPETGILLF